jgi:triphosphatase
LRAPERRTRKIRKQGKHLADLDPRRRHKLRVKAKKLRYGCEFFATIFPGKKPSRRRTRFAG